MSPTVVAISGLGSIGSQHLTAFATIPGIRIVAMDPDPALRRRAKSSLGVDSVCTDIEQLLDAEPAVLVIAGPDEVHLPQLIAATQRGTTVLVEKPLAPTYAEALDALPVIEATGAAVLVGYVLRHRAVVERTRELLAEDEIGSPVTAHAMLGAYSTITAASSRFATAEPDRLYRDYSHEWDYLRWFFGPIRQAFAAARTVTGLEHVEEPNCVDGLLEFRTGMRATFHLDYVEPIGTRTLHVLGTSGSLVADFARGTILVRTHGTNHAGVHELAEPAAAGLARQARHALAVSRGTELPRVTLRDGIAALAATEAVRQAAGSAAWRTLPALD